MAKSGPTGLAPDRPDGGDAQVRVRTCSRVGLTATPPRPRLGNLVRRR